MKSFRPGKFINFMFCLKKIIEILLPLDLNGKRYITMSLVLHEKTAFDWYVLLCMILSFISSKFFIFYFFFLIESFSEFQNLALINYKY